MESISLLPGMPASGKSTVALKMLEPKYRPLVRVNRDLLRLNLFGKYVNWKGEELVTEIQEAAIRIAVEMKHSVIIDDTCLNPKVIQKYIQLAEELHVPLFIFTSCLLVPFEECVRRDIFREKSVGREVIEKFYRNYFNEDGSYKYMSIIEPYIMK